VTKESNKEGYKIMSKKITLIVGSTRQNRVGGHVANWLVSVAKAAGTELEVIDLMEENLPFFDGNSPSYFPPETDAAKAWSAKISSKEAFIFLTAEYNRSIPAPLKNALDTIFKEWGNKPAAIVSYGYVDAGGSVTRHLVDVLSWLKLNIVEPKVAIQLDRNHLGEDGNFKDVDAALDHAKADFLATIEAINKA
jgi:NAD(P)H-dependent FMN reductase